MAASPVFWSACSSCFNGRRSTPASTSALLDRVAGLGDLLDLLAAELRQLLRRLADFLADFFGRLFQLRRGHLGVFARFLRFGLRRGPGFSAAALRLFSAASVFCFASARVFAASGAESFTPSATFFATSAASAVSFARAAASCTSRPSVFAASFASSATLHSAAAALEGFRRTGQLADLDGLLPCFGFGQLGFIPLRPARAPLRRRRRRCFLLRRLARVAGFSARASPLSPPLGASARRGLRRCLGQLAGFLGFLGHLPPRPPSRPASRLTSRFLAAASAFLVPPAPLVVRFQVAGTGPGPSSASCSLHVVRLVVGPFLSCPTWPVAQHFSCSARAGRFLPIEDVGRGLGAAFSPARPANLGCGNVAQPVGQLADFLRCTWPAPRRASCRLLFRFAGFVFGGSGLLLLQHPDLSGGACRSRRSSLCVRWMDERQPLQPVDHRLLVT